MRSFALFLAAAFSAPLMAADEVEELLLLKFANQNQTDVQKLRVYVNAAIVKAKDLRDTEPDRGIDILREINVRVDSVKMLPAAERREMVEVLQTIMTDMRNVSLTKRREKASSRLEAFREYLQVSGFESRYPGRSSSDGWEPANFWGTNGQARTSKLVMISTNFVRRKYQVQEENVLPVVVPIIQVFGGIYVFDRNNGHHVYLTNREFYDSVWTKLVTEWGSDPLRRQLTAAEVTRPTDERRLQASIDSGEFFLRGLPNLEPIPNVGQDEGPFLEFVAQTLMHKGLPRQIDRIYPLELQERLAGMSKMQMSAAKRTLHLLQLKDVAVSPLYAEILREEVTKVLKSEYTNFIEGEVNRTMLYVFSKLK